MICHLCRRSVLAGVRSIQRRGVATAPATSNAAPSQPPSSVTDFKTPATSFATPGISQPLSTPFLGSTPIDESAPTNTKKELKKTKLQGSISGGAELKGLAWLKVKPQVLANEDSEYPAWLWTILDDGKTASGAAAVDVAAMSKRRREKYERKQDRLMKNVPKPIPVHEQSKDLTSPQDDAVISLQRRQEITKSSRQARRKGIRESNFLKGM